MKILFITIAWPDQGDRNLYSDLLHEFSMKGHKVFVAHASEKHEQAILSEEDGIHVLRFPTQKIQKAGKLKKAIALSTLGYKFKKNIAKYYADNDFDLIISHTPPVTLSGVMCYVKKKYDAFFYLLLKDIWPHSSASVNVIKKDGLIFKFFRWHEKRMYRTADVIGCMSPENVEFVLKKNPFLKEGNVEECPNSIKPRHFESINKAKIREKYSIPADATVFIFSGNLSIGHGLDFYMEVIEELENYENAFFLIGGSGTHYQFLKDNIEERQLDNVLLYEWLPKEDFIKIIQASDVGIILLRSDYSVPQFPSRLLAYLEASKPVLCAVNADTDIGTIVEEAGCGVSVIHGNKEALVEKIKMLSESTLLREKMGLKARDLLEKRYTCEQGYTIIMNHFEDEMDLVRQTSEIPHLSE